MLRIYACLPQENFQFKNQPCYRGGAVASTPESVKMDEDEQELQNLLETLESIENEIANAELKERLGKLRERARLFLKKQQEKIKILQVDMQSLKEEVEILKREKETIEKEFTVAQITWRFDAHIARFVVDDPDETISEYGTFRQMHDYLKEHDHRENYWKEIQSILSIDYSQEHDGLKQELRKDRNEIAHPRFIDLDDLDQLAEFKKLSKYDKKRMGEMVDMLKMTASLMKFGRLAQCLHDRSTNRLFSVWSQREKRIIRRALRKISSWDRDFETIKGLQNIEHEEAKSYLQKYINDASVKRYYHFIVDFIKNENGKRLGKLAKNIAKFCPPKEMSSEHEALQKLQDLLKMSKPEEKIEEIRCDIAKLHIPDFLPKYLWKGGTEMVENYFRLKRKSKFAYQ